MSTVAAFVRRKLNRTKAALLLAEARHTTLDHTPGSRPDPVCFDCRTVNSLRRDVAAGEIALKQAEAMR